MKSFEENIKDKADSFQMDPVAGSFDQVMKALEKKKKRRFILWLWFIIPGIVLGSGSVFIYQFNSTSSSTFTSSVLQSSYKHAKLNVKHSAKKWAPGILTQNSAEKTHTQNLPVYKNATTHHTLVMEKKGGLSNQVGSNYVKAEINSVSEVVDKGNTTTSITQKTNQIFEKRQPETFVLQFHQPVTYFPFVVGQGSVQPNQFPFIHTKKPVVSFPYSKWALGIYTELGANRSQYDYIPDSAGGGYGASRAANDKFLFSYSAGIHLRYAPVKFLAIETGVGFTHYESNQIITNGGSGTTSAVVDQSYLDTVLTLFSVDSSSKEYHNMYDYISIPLKVYYQKKWKWTGIETGAGLIFDIPVNTQSYVADANTGLSYLRTKVKDARLNMFGVQASINLHMVFYANKFSFFAGPVFKYRMNSMFDKNYIIGQHTYFIGAELGARYNF